MCSKRLTNFFDIHESVRFIFLNKNQKQMHTCPLCQKTHEEDKFFCDECQEYYCSLECLQYKNFPEHDERGVGELADLTFNCCDTCYCAKCHSWMMYSDTGEVILWCEICERLFHDNCDCDIENGSESCMCKLCIDLKNNEKKVICKACHEQYDVEQLSFADLYDLEKYISFESPEWENLVSRQFFGRRAKGEFPDPKNMEYYIGFDFSDCKKFEKLKEILNRHYSTVVLVKNEDASDKVNQYITKEIVNYKEFENIQEFYKACIRDCLNCKHIECECKFCKNVKCNTLLFRLMFNDFGLNDHSNAWDMGNDFTPIEILKSIAENSENDCNCDICQFWKAYN